MLDGAGLLVDFHERQRSCPAESLISSMFHLALATSSVLRVFINRSWRKDLILAVVYLVESKQLSTVGQLAMLDRAGLLVDVDEHQRSHLVDTTAISASFAWPAEAHGSDA
jgi:hypothetical protein